MAHHTAGGCNLCPGDLLGTGTLSGPDAGSRGSLLELTQGDREPISGEQPRFLQAGDEITLRAQANRAEFACIDLGPCRAIIQ